MIDALQLAACTGSQKKFTFDSTSLLIGLSMYAHFSFELICIYTDSHKTYTDSSNICTDPCKFVSGESAHAYLRPVAVSKQELTTM